MKNPGSKKRGSTVCEEWLLGITTNTLRQWLRDTDPRRRKNCWRGRERWKDPESREGRWDWVGLFMHEVQWLQVNHPDAAIRTEAADIEARWRQGWIEQQEQDRREEETRARKAAERDRKAEAREERIEARKRLMAESLVAHKEQYPGDVRKAANRAAELYLGSPVPRTLKQCLAIAAREEEVAFASIRSYLAGVGVRALFAENSGADFKEPECEVL